MSRLHWSAPIDGIDQPPPAVGGWLLVLVLLLLAWGPIESGLMIAGALAAIPIRGPTLAAALVLRICVTALGIAAGLALLGRRTAAVTLTRVFLVLSAVLDIAIDLTPYVPNNRMPGDERYYVAGTALYAVAWLTYLSRSRRVRQTFDENGTTARP
jgi:hypothetical protein